MTRIFLILSFSSLLFSVHSNAANERATQAYKKCIDWKVADIPSALQTVPCSSIQNELSVDVDIRICNAQFLQLTNNDQTALRNLHPVVASQINSLVEKNLQKRRDECGTQGSSHDLPFSSSESNDEQGVR